MLLLLGFMLMDVFSRQIIRLGYQTAPRLGATPTSCYNPLTMRIVLPALRYFWVVSIVSLLVLTAIAVSLNLSASRPLYEWMASRILDRDVQIAGPITLRFGALTTLAMDGITIAGTTPSAPIFAKIGSAVAQISPLALLDDAIVITAVAVADVDLFIDIDKTGQGNWPVFDRETEGDNARGSHYVLRTSDVQIERTHLRVQDARNNRRSMLFVDALHQTLAEDNFLLSSQGRLNETPFETTLTLDSVESLWDVRNWGVDWRGSLGNANFQLSTTIASLDHLMRSEIDVTIHADSTNAVLRALALPLIDDGASDVALRTRRHNDKQLIELDAKLGELRINGSASQDLSALGESGHVAIRASGPSLSQYGALWGAAGWPATPFDIDLEASIQGSEIDVQTFQLNSAVLNLSLAGKLPAYRSLDTGTLAGNIDIPDLSAFTGLLNLPRPLQGALHGTLLLTRDAGGTDIIVTSRSPMLSAELSGRLTPGDGLLGSTLRFSGKSARPEQWLGLIMDDPPGLTTIEFMGEATVSGIETLAFENLVVRLNNAVLSAEGIWGWATARHQTAISLTAQSQNLRATLAPWVATPRSIPDVPASATVQLSYPSSGSIRIARATLSAAQSMVQFSGGVSLGEAAPTVSGVWDASTPAIQPLFPLLTVPQRYETPLRVRGNIEWEPGAIAIDIDDNDLRYGSITADGHLSIDLDDHVARFNVLARTPDARDYLPGSDRGLDKPKLPMNITVIGEWNKAELRAETLRVESTEIQVAAAGFLELSGQKFIRSHLDADINIKRLSVLNDFLDFPLPDLDLELTADLDSRGGALVIDSLTLRSGDSDLTVQGAVERPSDVRVKLDISSDRLNLTPWTTALREPDDARGEHDTRSTSGQYVVPDYPIATHWVSRFSADANLKIAELIGLPRPVYNVQGALMMGNDGIRIERLSAQNERSGGATLSGSLLIPPDAAPQFDIAIEGFDLVMGIPKAPSEEIESLPTYQFKSTFSGAGHTTRELASSLQGYLNVVMGSGKVLNVGFDRLTNSLLQELSQILNPLQSVREATLINCAAAFVTIENGRLWGKPALVVDTPDVKIFSNVTLDLGSERVNAKFKAVPQKGLGFSVSSVVNPYVEVSGTLARPKITMDPTNSVVGGSLAVMTSGLSILAQNVVDRMQASGNVCAARLSTANEEISTRDRQN